MNGQSCELDEKIDGQTDRRIDGQIDEQIAVSERDEKILQLVRARDLEEERCTPNPNPN